MTPLDRFRIVAPHLAVAVYAMTPGGPVTIELITEDGSVSTFRGATEAEVWEQILPGVATPAPEAAPADDDIFN